LRLLLVCKKQHKLGYNLIYNPIDFLHVLFVFHDDKNAKTAIVVLFNQYKGMITYNAVYSVLGMVKTTTALPFSSTYVCLKDFHGNITTQQILYLF